MKEWGDDESTPPAGWWRDDWVILDPKRQFLEDAVIVAGAIAYFAVLCWPLYGLVFGSASEARNLTILGGLIGLLLASYSVMTNRILGIFRVLIGLAGVFFIVVCWGFGPL